DRSSLQDVEAIFGIRRLPSLTVPRCSSLPAPRADRLPPADPLGSERVQCTSRHPRTGRASTAEYSGASGEAPQDALGEPDHHHGKRLAHPLCCSKAEGGYDALSGKSLQFEYISIPCPAIKQGPAFLTVDPDVLSNPPHRASSDPSTAVRFM